MIRNAMFGLSLLALSTGSALAAPAHRHATTTQPRVVAEASAPAADSTAPAGEKTEKKAKKSKAKKDKASDAGKTEGAKEMKAAPTPAN